jgi:hemerythrin-like metal-binding protein
MEHFEWTPAMTLGIPAMDAMHRSFMEHLSDMIEAPAERFCVEFPDLVKRVEEDFHEEERLMDAIDYPSLLAHREQHARVLSGLHHILPQVLAGDVETGRQTIDLLAQWFGFHMMTMDTALAYALEMAEAPPDAKPSTRQQDAARFPANDSPSGA